MLRFRKWDRNIRNSRGSRAKQENTDNIGIGSVVEENDMYEVRRYNIN